MEEKLPPLTREKRYYDIVQKGVTLLSDSREYKQINLLHKLKILDLVISPASFSNIINGKPVGRQVLKKAADGIEVIVRKELGLEYSKELRAFVPAGDPDWKPYILPETPASLQDKPGFTLHPDGRVSIPHKTAFISTAQKEVIEVGIRLKTFTEYFFSRKDKEYKEYVVALLKRGVCFKGYLLDPECNEARLYFDDRARADELEKDSVGEMKKVLEKLTRLIGEFDRQRYPGSFEIYLYRHIPCNHFLVVDHEAEGGKMMVSHYMYGVRRAECPVWEFTRSDQPELFAKYAVSLKAFIKEARALKPAGSFQR